MATFELLADPTYPWLRRGHYVQMVNGAKDWGDKYKAEWYQVMFTEMLRRDYRAGFLPAAETSAFSIDPEDDIGLEPKYYATIYQTRIGLSDGWNLYIQWPSGSYRMMLEDDLFVLDPVASGTELHRKYIGFLDAIDSPLDLPRLQWFFVKDHMPILLAAVSSVLDYEPLLMRFHINKLRLIPVESLPNDRGGGPQKIAELKSGRQLSTPLYHHKQYAGGETWI